jgi:hypothetical protein
MYSTVSMDGEMRDVYKTLVRKPEGNKTLQRHTCR